MLQTVPVHGPGVWDPGVPVASVKYQREYILGTNLLKNKDLKKLCLRNITLSFKFVKSYLLRGCAWESVS